MSVLDGFSRLEICLNIEDKLFFESFSFYTVVSRKVVSFCTNFYSWIEVLSLRNEQVDFLFHDLRPIVRKRHLKRDV